MFSEMHKFVMATSRSCRFITFFTDVIVFIVNESRLWCGHCLSVCHKPSVRLCSSYDHDKAVIAEL